MMFGGVSSGTYAAASAAQKGYVWSKENGFSEKNPGPKPEVSQKEIDQTTFLAIEAVMALADVKSETTPAKIRRAIALLHPEVIVKDVVLMKALQMGHRRGVFVKREHAIEYEEEQEFEDENGEPTIYLVPATKVVATYAVDHRNASSRDSTLMFAKFVDNLMHYARVRKQAIKDILENDPHSLVHLRGYEPDPLLDPSESVSNIVNVPLDEDWASASRRGIHLNHMGMSTLKHTGAAPSGLSHFYVGTYDSNLPDMDDPKPRTFKIDKAALKNTRIDPIVAKLAFGAVGGHPLGNKVLQQRALSAEESAEIRRMNQQNVKTSFLNGMKADYIDMSLDGALPPQKRGSYVVNSY